MLVCRLVSSRLTAFADGEVSGWTARYALAHVQRCSFCSGELALLRSVVAQQTHSLRALQAQQSVSVAELWRRLHHSVVARPAVDSPAVWVWLRPVALAASVTLVSLLGLVSAAGGPQAVLVPLGIQPPPPPVSRAPVLFREYPLIEKLELLEHLETVDRIRLDDEGESQSG